MEFRHLRFFIAVAEDLNFSRAAERLHVAQPHLSREIRRLEDQMGVVLFSRDRRRIALTGAGLAFLDRARRLIEASAEAVRSAQLAHRGETGSLRIGFSSSAGFGLLPEAVRQFRLRRPGVELSLTEYNSDEQPSLLETSQLDACLLYPPQRLAPGLSRRLLAEDPLVVALPETHPAAAWEWIELASLADDAWIFFPRRVASRLHDTILAACNGAGFSPRVVQQALKLATISSLAASGLGIALVPLTLARLRLPGMTYRPLAPPVPTMPLSLLWRSADANPALPAFLDQVTDVSRDFAGAEAAC